MPEPSPPIDSRSKADLQLLVREVDAELEYVSDLHPLATSCRTLLVKKSGERCTLKLRKLSNNIWDEMYFYYEIHALHRAAERNLEGVTHLLREYRTDRYHAILKSFVEGTPCDSTNVDELLADRHFIAKLDKLYLKLHLAGIAKINFLPRKLVISDEGELILVDLSTCIVNTECGIQLFAQKMREDSNFITKLEKKMTKLEKKRSNRRTNDSASK